MSHLARYSLATLTPLALLLAAGTVWPTAAWLALAWLTLLAGGLDRVLAKPEAAATTHPGFSALSIGLALATVPLLAVVLASPTEALSTATQIALVLATASFLGQVAHPNAHELIHRQGAMARGLGAAVYASLGFGQHTAAHKWVHHIHVGTEADPNTPRPGEIWWAYLPRAWLGSISEGTRVASKHRKRGPRAALLWVLAPLAVTLGAYGLSGARGVALYLTLALLFGAQVLMSDYIQHYGLHRQRSASGKYEPIAPHHSWNAPMGFSSFLMLNAPSHSEHHLNAGRSYAALDPNGPGPLLPHAMPVMAMLALVPPVWRRVMDKRVAKVLARAHCTPAPSAERHAAPPREIAEKLPGHPARP